MILSERQIATLASGEPIEDEEGNWHYPEGHPGALDPMPPGRLTGLLDGYADNICEALELDRHGTTTPRIGSRLIRFTRGDFDFSITITKEGPDDTRTL